MGLQKRLAAGLVCGLFASVVAAGAADAQAMRRAPQSSGSTYLFGEYDYYSAKYGSLNGAGFGAGWRFMRNFALEGGAQFATKSGVNVRNFYGQALFIYPYSSRLEFSASLGGAYLDASTKVLATKVSIGSAGYRAGLGVNYWLTPSLALRAGVHRQNAGGLADDIALGLAYRF